MNVLPARLALVLLALIGAALLAVFINPDFLIRLTVRYHTWNLKSLGFHCSVRETERTKRHFRIRAFLLAAYLLGAGVVAFLLSASPSTK